MIKTQSRGIILSKKNKIFTLIDEHYGRIIGSSFQDLTIGNIYEYRITEFKTMYNLMHEELIIIPIALARTDILFLHYLLEFLFFCTPVGSCVEGIFEIIMWTYHQNEEWFTNKHKNYILFKIIHSLGLLPQQKKATNHLLKMYDIPITKTDEEVLKLVTNKELEQCILSCVLHLPLLKKLKTNIFLEKIGHHDYTN